MLTALQGHFTKISSKVRKIRQERERSVSNVGQAMTEPEVFRSRRNINNDGAFVSRTAADCSMHIFSNL